MATIIDPPEGWKYGFPKPIPEDRIKDVRGWLIEQGYPPHVLKSYGDSFYYRTWEHPENQESNEKE